MLSELTQNIEEKHVSFFVEQEQIGEGVIAVTGPDVNHIKNVLRMKPGERVLISAKAGVIICV